MWTRIMYVERLLTLSVPLSVVGALLFPTAAVLAQQAVVLDSAFLAGYRWRNLGPDRGGRSIAVTGVKGRPDEAYFGAVGGACGRPPMAGTTGRRSPTSKSRRPRWERWP